MFVRKICTYNIDEIDYRPQMQTDSGCHKRHETRSCRSHWKSAKKNFEFWLKTICWKPYHLMQLTSGVDLITVLRSAFVLRDLQWCNGVTNFLLCVLVMLGADLLVKLNCIFCITCKFVFYAKMLRTLTSALIWHF